MDDYFLFYYYYSYEEADKMSDKQRLQTSSTQTKGYETQEDNVEIGMFTCDQDTLVIALFISIPILWLFLPIYIIYRKRQRQQLKPTNVEEGRPLYINDDNSSQLLPQQPDNSAMCPAKITCSFTTEKDHTTTMTLDTEQQIDGTFQYKLDSNDSFQPCSTKQTWSKLSAGTHNIKIKFIPTNFPELFALETCQFNVEPMAHGSVSVTEDTATINLYSNVEGEFSCCLDGKIPLKQCYDGFTTDKLSIGHHYINFQFPSTGLHQPLYQEVVNFLILPTIVCAVATDKGTATMNLHTKQNVDGAFWYSLDGIKPFRQCSSGDTMSNLPAGVHNIIFKFIPTKFSDTYIVSKKCQFEIKHTAYGSVSVNEDTATIKLHSDIEGSFKYYLDGTSSNQCYDGLTIDKLPIGQHYFNFEFTPTGSPHPLYQNTVDIVIYPTIVCVVDTDKDTATMNLYAKQKVDGTFWYSLDDIGPFQSCSSGETLSNLSAGAHHIIFKFIPTKFSDAYIVSKTCRFKIKPTARGSASVDGDNTTIELHSNAKGTYKCSLDGGQFQQCVSGKKFSKLAAGSHKVFVQFIVDTSFAELDCFSDEFVVEFVVEQIAEIFVTLMEDDATMNLYSNFPAKFHYSLDGEEEFQSCSSMEKLLRLLAGDHHVIVQFNPTESSLQMIEKSKKFTIPLTAKGTVTIRKDKVTLELTSNAAGLFQYSLDAQEFEHCNAVPYQECLQEIPQLSAGKHSVTIQFVTSSAVSSKGLNLEPLINFTIFSKDLYTSQCQPVGFQNIGNTCFFNSALQSVCKTDVFHHLCLHWNHVWKYHVSTTPLVNDSQNPELILEPYGKSYEIPSKTCDTHLDLSVQLKPGPLTEAWICLFTNISTSLPRFAFWPKDLLKQLGKRHSRFVQGTQEDSHEALRCLFDVIKNEEIEQVKNAVKEQFGVTNSQTEAMLDGEDKLKMKGYLRMASKQPTIIDEVVGGKIVSVTICHECHDVSENLEPFFDISLTMPEETLPKFDNEAAAYTWKGDKINININNYSDENGNRVPVQPNDKEDLDDIESQKAACDAKVNVDAMESETDKLHFSSQSNTSSTSPNEDLPATVEPQVPETWDELPALYANRQRTPPADTNQVNQQHPTLQHPTLQNDISLEKLETQNVADNGYQSKEPESSEGSDTGMGNSPTVAVPGITDTENNSNTSTMQSNLTQAKQPSAVEVLESLTPNQHIAEKNAAKKADQKSQQGIEETAGVSSELPASQETKQEVEEAQQEDTENKTLEVEHHKSNITNDKDLFQEYLMKKGLKHQPKGKQAYTNDLQFCLSVHTDLDVLDENNKFICQACTAQKQLANMDDEIALCQVSKQIMIHHLPPVLILHMKRFDIGFDEVTKDDRHISFPEILDMAPYCTTECLEEMGDLKGRILYGLYAVVVHQGRNLGHGHYIACVKTRPTQQKTLNKGKCKDGYYDDDYCRKGHWYYTSDTYVRECSYEEVKECKAYMLFYEQLPCTSDSIPTTEI